MFIDGRSVPNGESIDTDVCIIGTGPAGITLGLELADSPVRVCLLESGDFEPQPKTTELSEGETTGHPYRRLDGSRSVASGVHRSTGMAGAGLSTISISRNAAGCPTAGGHSTRTTYSPTTPEPTSWSGWDPRGSMPDTGSTRTVLNPYPWLPTSFAPSLPVRGRAAALRAILPPALRARAEPARLPFFQRRRAPRSARLRAGL